MIFGGGAFERGLGKALMNGISALIKETSLTPSATGEDGHQSVNQEAGSHRVMNVLVH